jgi:hypothetical protein
VAAKSGELNGVAESVVTSQQNPAIPQLLASPDSLQMPGPTMLLVTPLTVCRQVAIGDRPRAGAEAAVALATLAAVTLVDLACANGLNSEKGSRKTATRSYADRSGFPQGLHAARGAARDFKVPDDMKTPELLRPWDQAKGGRHT